MGKKKKDKLTIKKLMAAQSMYEERSLEATLIGKAKLAKQMSERAKAITLVLELHRTDQL